MSIDEVPNISLGSVLEHLVGHCETRCVAECCGFDAYDFSPLNIAYYFKYRGEVSISNKTIEDMESNIVKFEAKTSSLTPNDDGYICTLERMNTYCTPENIKYFIKEVRYNMRLAHKISGLSENVRLKLK